MLTRRQLLSQAIALGMFPALASRVFAAMNEFEQQPPRNGEEWLLRHMRGWLGEYPIPGMSCGLMLNGQIAAEAALGVRKWGDPTPILVSDAQQIGSITKVVTGALTAKLIERGVLTWDTTLAEVFPELVRVMQPAYRGVTVKLLMAHLSGMPYSPQTETDNGFQHLPLRIGRYEYVRAAIIDAPQAEPGTKFIYGGGPIIVAAMLEKLTGRLWEELMTEVIFQPLGMASSRFGVEPDQFLSGASVVWEHTIVNGQPNPIQPAGQFAHGFKRVHGPAGCIDSTTGDMLRFMSAYFPDATGATGFFSAASYRTLTSLVNNLKAPGFGVDEQIPSTGEAARLAFEGCNLRNIAVINLCPQTRNGFIWMVNSFGDEIKPFTGTAGRVLSRPVLAGYTNDPHLFKLNIDDQISGLTVEWWQYEQPIENYIRKQHTFLLRPDDLQNRFSGSSPWSDGDIVFDCGKWDGGGRLKYKPAQSILGSWQHFAFVVDRSANQMSIYRNGIREANGPSTSFLQPGQYELCVGGDTTPFPGRLSEFRLWNYARSQADINAQMHQSAPPQSRGLLAYVRGPQGLGLPVQN